MADVHEVGLYAVMSAGLLLVAGGLLLSLVVFARASFEDLNLAETLRLMSTMLVPGFVPILLGIWLLFQMLSASG